MADENRREPRGLAPALLAIAALGVFLWLGARTMKLTDRLPGRGATTVDQAVIVERTRAVARLVTSVASASRVFSPPESTLAGLNASSPENRNEPRIERACVLSSSGATCCRFSNTVAFKSNVSCSCAK